MKKRKKKKKQRLTRIGVVEIAGTGDGVVGMAKVGTTGMAEAGIVGMAETGAAGVAGGVVMGIAMSATTSGSSKVSITRKTDIQSEGRLHQKVI